MRLAQSLALAAALFTGAAARADVSSMEYYGESSDVYTGSYMVMVAPRNLTVTYSVPSIVLGLVLNPSALQTLTPPHPWRLGLEVGTGPH